MCVCEYVCLCVLVLRAGYGDLGGFGHMQLRPEVFLEFFRDKKRTTVSTTGSSS